MKFDTEDLSLVLFNLVPMKIDALLIQVHFAFSISQNFGIKVSGRIFRYQSRFRLPSKYTVIRKVQNFNGKLHYVETMRVKCVFVECAKPTLRYFRGAPMVLQGNSESI